jgi:hypothetical protein
MDGFQKEKFFGSAFTKRTAWFESNRIKNGHILIET